MKLVCCFVACGKGRIAPAPYDHSKQYLVQGAVDSQTCTSTGLDSDRNAHRNVKQSSGEPISRETAVQAANQLETALGSLLAAAALLTAEPGSVVKNPGQPDGSNSQGTNAIPFRPAKLPHDITALQERLTQACSSMGQPAESIAHALSQASAHLLAYARQQQQQQQQQWQQLRSASRNQQHRRQQQQQQQEALQGLQECRVAAADALVNIINVILFAQVTLDSAAVLKRRYLQYSQLLSTLGLQDSTLAACVGPANKAMIACLVCGSKAAAGEARVSVMVHRRATFWDALEQLQQQHPVLPHPEQQVAGAVQLTKLFPRFVDESLQQQQQPMMMTTGAAGRNLGSSSSSTTSSSNGMQAVEGGEGHGPRKEFFHLVGENVKVAGRDKVQQPALFVHLRVPGTWWFNTTLACSPRLQAAYWAVGWLLGQALTNRCTVAVQLAPLLFDRLLLPPHQPFKPSLDMLEQHDPEAAQGLTGVLELQAQQYQQLLQVEGHAAGLSRHEYVQQALQQLLVEDIAWQFKALQQGFRSAVDCQVLRDCCFTGVSLAAAVCGCPTDTPDSDFDIRQVFRIVLEDEEDDLEQAKETIAVPGKATVPPGGSGGAVVVDSGGSGVGPGSVAGLLQCLWEVLGGWSPRQKRAFVKFVTGSDRLPSPGSEQIILSFPFVAYGPTQQQQLLGTLPQSHTCANTLELPNYLEALVATNAQLALEWQQARMAHGRDSCSSSSSSSRASAGTVVGCECLLRRCCEVLEDRLTMAITSCDSYGLDALTGTSAATSGPSSHLASHQAVLPHQPAASQSKARPFSPDLGNVDSNNSGEGALPVATSVATIVAAAPAMSRVTPASSMSSQNGLHDDRKALDLDEGKISKVPQVPVQKHAGSPRGQGSGLYHFRPLQPHQQVGQQLLTWPNPQQQLQQQHLLQQQQGHPDRQRAPTSKPKLLSDSDEELLDQILNEEL